MRSLFVCLTMAVLLAGCQKASSLLPIGAQGTKADLPSALATKLSAADLAKLPALAEQARAARLGTIAPIEGRVDFPPIRAVQASVGDVINFATVTLYDPGLARSVAATVTNSNGGFSLALANWVPDPDVPYVLEATKGLGNYLPGWANPRFRTLVRYNSTSKAWESTSVPGIVIGAQTTAVAIEAGLYSDRVKPDLTFGSVDVSVRPAGFLPKPVFFAGQVNATPNPDYSGHNIAELVKLSADIMTYLANDVDPIISVPEVVPSVTGMTPDHGKAKDIVRITGRGFSPLMTGNKVTFNGIVANVLLAKPTEITVEVPAGATTGGMIVEGRGATAARTFTIDPIAAAFGIDFVYPSTGTPGTTVTILGFGFSKTPSDNTVYFDNVTTTCLTSDTNFCTAVVPAAAAKGPLSVDVKNAGSSNTLPFSVIIQPTVISMFPTQGAPDHEVTLEGSNFGSVSGTVKVSGVAASILSWTDTKVVAAVPSQTVSGSLTLTKGVLPPVSFGNFGILSGNITGWTAINTSSSNYSHNGAWHGRWGKWWYLGGGYTNSTAAQGSGYFKGPMERAEIGPDGSLGPLQVLPGIETGEGWWTNEAGYNIANSPTVIGNYAYHYPSYGYLGQGCSNRDVYRAQFFPDGSITNFAPVYKTAFPVGNWSAQIRIKDYVYIIGGDCGHEGKIESARINPDGTLQAFTVLSIGAPYGSNNGVAQIGKYLYFFGGSGQTAVYRIEIDIAAGGALKGGWAAQTSLPRTLGHGNAAVIGKYLYLFGGATAEWGWTGAVWRAAINSADDSLGAWQQVLSQTIAGAHDGGVLVVGNKVYYTGRCCHYPDISIGTIE